MISSANQQPEHALNDLQGHKRRRCSARTRAVVIIVIIIIIIILDNKDSLSFGHVGFILLVD